MQKKFVGSGAVKVVVFTLLALAMTAGVAVAANLTGGNNNNTIIGTTGNDNITDGNGNDFIWGLGGSDNINIGFGNDTIDAGGSCPAGSQGSITPGNGGTYCQHGPKPPCGSDNIAIAGGGQNGGNDHIYFNCGQTSLSISRGQGTDVIYAYGGANTINLNDGNDTVYAGKGYATAGSNISTGKGNDVIYAQNGFVDTINCGSKNTVVYADKNDRTSNCTVKYTSPSRDGAAHRATHRRRAHSHKRGHSRSHRHSHKRGHLHA